MLNGLLLRLIVTLDVVCEGRTPAHMRQLEPQEGYLEALDLSMQL